MASERTVVERKKVRGTWHVYAVGGLIYAGLAVWLFATGQGPIIAWICTGSAVIGFLAAVGLYGNPPTPVDADASDGPEDGERGIKRF